MNANADKCHLTLEKMMKKVLKSVILKFRAQNVWNFWCKWTRQKI